MCALHIILTAHSITLHSSFSRYEVNQDHHDHLIDVDTGEILEFHHEGLEQLKEKIAQEMGYDLVDHRLELYAKKRKKN